MEIVHLLLDFTLLPVSIAFLLFIAPLVAAMRFATWAFGLFFPEDVRGKVVVITGASSGIGQEAARVYAQKGARLVLAGRREEELRRTAEMCKMEGAEARVALVDVTVAAECEKLINDTIAAFGRLDHLVNNAGIAHSFFMEEAKNTDVAEVMDVNFWGAIYPTFYALPHLRRSQGHIVVTSSVASFIPYPRMAIYNAAKAALVNFFDTLRVEVGDEVGITVATPGWVESEMTAGKFVTAEGRVVWDKEQRDRYVRVPSWYTTFLYYRVFAPDVMESLSRLLFTAPRGKTPISKMVVEAVSVLVELNKAWGMWPKNTNATTACTAWPGVHCTPRGFVVALTLNEAVDPGPPPGGVIPPSITRLSALQHLDLTYGIYLKGPLPSLAALTRLTYLALGEDSVCKLTGTYGDLTWLSTLSNLQTLRLTDMVEFKGDLSSLAIISNLRSLRDLRLCSLTNATGQIPRDLRYLTVLTALDLSYLRASDFPDWVVQLSNLRTLNLNTDEVTRHGVLPDGISLLTNLTQLLINRNNLAGYLPGGLSNLVNLQQLSLNYNMIQGAIPGAYSTLTALTALDLSWNQLSGAIPPIFTTNLESLILSYNGFESSIPPHLALPTLTELELKYNRFTGGFPATFTRLTAIYVLDVTNNSLSAGLDVIARMPWLTDIMLSTNNFSGAIPEFFTAFTSLGSIDLSNNRFTGPFPDLLLTHTGLIVLNLANNSFSGRISQQLSALTDLSDINLSDNQFHGAIPSALYQLPSLLSLQVANNFLLGGLPPSLKASSSLTMLDVAGNGITGNLPDFSRWRVNLVRLAANNNNLTGPIPDSISTLTSLDTIMLNDNQLSGSIPDALLTLTNLKFLYLANNQLSGTLPSAISRLQNLEQLWLDNNSIQGILPPSICSLPVLWRIMVSNNHLHGPLPVCLFDKCINQIDVSGNSLYGRVNRNFRNMVADGDALVNLARNYFNGDAVLFADGCQVCPIEINQPNRLELGDTSTSNAAGKCVGSVSAMRDYSVAGAGKSARVSLSYNCLTLNAEMPCSSNATQRSTAECQAFCSITENGPCDGHGECVPPAPGASGNFSCVCDAGYSTLTSVNGSTCGIVNSTTTVVSSLSTGAIVGIAVGCFAGITLLTAVLAWLLWPRGPKKWEGLDVCEQFSLQQIMKATNNWAAENVLGEGGFGIVYKGVSPQGLLWAIKRSTVMTNEFETEVRAMANLHHVNLVRLLGFCLDQNTETGKQEQILVYEFVGNRDLQYHIHKTKRALSLRQRLRLAQGTAEGLAYLHGFETSIVHRDIKPANILVTHDMQAKVADFGLLKRLTHGADADATRVAGTPGYVDPDYNRTQMVTAKSDVFSYGIVLLELLTGKSPQVNNKTHIRKWAAKLVEAYELEQLKDDSLECSEEAIVDFADLALDCIKSPGTRRPDMKDIAYRLKTLIDKHCPNREDEWECVEGDDKARLTELSGSGAASGMSSNMSSGLSSGLSSGVSAGDSQMSQGSYKAGNSFMSLGSNVSGVRSWLQSKLAGGR
ncbi:unnamed protein product [Closterium sp. Naga37s-1]|nr:unnamed protein product [Closterium sp. Naga37s-1]